MERKLTASLEDYLEAILKIRDEKGIVRVKDIAKALNVKTSSVVSAIKSLTDKGLVNHEHYGYTKLTREGEQVAEEVYRRHKILYKLLSEVLKIPYEIAENDACAMEHHLSKETLERITKLIGFITACHLDKPIWLENLHYFIKENKMPDKCKLCEGAEK
ncbi:MAG: metal-dependent transcriptional regulator [Candidatus Coatesbacteria bacterium]|nr:MAG: metal-dependent transcriptional regulator [Candidatus Coatesbacteria bacterium]RLC39788.1 MAG: metal-dependent transcriptional regulator [Candidatus Coatesbacteria bacterium]RLC42155.1 MAG: metal-dependent transcriptional regulator [Candidatus Coatesbacteria bacterium]